MTDTPEQKPAPKETDAEKDKSTSNLLLNLFEGAYRELFILPVKSSEPPPEPKVDLKTSTDAQKDGGNIFDKLDFPPKLEITDACSVAPSWNPKGVEVTVKF